MMGIDRDGAFAEYVSVPERSIYKIPDSMNDPRYYNIRTLQKINLQ